MPLSVRPRARSSGSRRRNPRRRCCRTSECAQSVYPGQAGRQRLRSTEQPPQGERRENDRHTQTRGDRAQRQRRASPRPGHAAQRAGDGGRVQRLHQRADALAGRLHAAGVRPRARLAQRDHACGAERAGGRRLPVHGRPRSRARLGPGAGRRPPRCAAQRAGVHRRLRAQPAAAGQQHRAADPRSQHRAADADRRRPARRLRRALAAGLSGGDLPAVAGAGLVRARRRARPAGAGGGQRARVEAPARPGAEVLAAVAAGADQQPAQRRGDRGDGHAAADPQPLVRPAPPAAAHAGAGQRPRGRAGRGDQVRSHRAAVAGAGLRRPAGARREDDRRHDDRRLDPRRPGAGAGGTAGGQLEADRLRAPGVRPAARTARHPSAAPGGHEPAPAARPAFRSRWPRPRLPARSG